MSLWGVPLWPDLFWSLFFVALLAFIPAAYTWVEFPSKWPGVAVFGFGVTLYGIIFGISYPPYWAVGLVLGIVTMVVAAGFARLEAKK